MYCQKCFASLLETTDNHCAKCGKEFDRTKPSTFLRRPFPDVHTIIRHLIITTILAAGVAFVVSIFTMARSSGH